LPTCSGKDVALSKQQIYLAIGVMLIDGFAATPIGPSLVDHFKSVHFPKKRHFLSIIPFL
jgi:hypothetical protein